MSHLSHRRGDPLDALSLTLEIRARCGAGSSWGMLGSEDGAQTWSSINTGLTSQSIQTLLLDPHDSTTLYAGTPAGLFKSTNRGSTWQLVLESKTGFVLAVDPLGDNTIYAASSAAGILKSTDGGKNWVTLNSCKPATGISCGSIRPVPTPSMQVPSEEYALARGQGAPIGGFRP